MGQQAKFIIITDLNKDGFQDIVTANFESSSISVLIGLPGGNFAPAVNYPSGQNPTAIDAADFDQDGNIDLIVANVETTCRGCPQSLTLFHGNGDGTLQPGVFLHVDGSSAAVAATDLDLNGIPDIIAGDQSFIFVLLGQRDGIFSRPAGYKAGTTGHAIVTPDLNRDRKPDVVVANYNSSSITVFLGQGDGTLTSGTTYSVGQKPHGLAFGDLNGDGLVDLVTANQNSDSVSILLGTGDGSFLPAFSVPVGKNPTSVAVGDFNRDGIADLAVADSGCTSPAAGCVLDASGVTILLGAGGGTFLAPVNYSKGTGADAIATSDLNGDGIPDLAIGTLIGKVIILFGKGDGTF